MSLETRFERAGDVVIPTNRITTLETEFSLAVF